MSLASPQPGMASAGSPPPRRTVPAVLAICGLIVLAAAAVVSLLMVDRQAPSGSPGSPEDVVRDYFAAADRDDCDAMVDMVSDSRLRYSGFAGRGEAADRCAASAEAFTDPIEVVSTDVVEAEEDDDYAVISVELRVGGRTDEHEVTLYLERGRWRLWDSEVYDEV